VWPGQCGLSTALGHTQFWCGAAVTDANLAVLAAWRSFVAVGPARDRRSSCGDPQRDVGRSRQTNDIRRNDLMFRFLNRDELAELVGFRDLALANRLGVGVGIEMLGRWTVRATNGRTES